jgi:hypothetical protein
LQPERHREHRASRLAVLLESFLAVARDCVDARILEDRNVQVRTSCAWLSNHKHGVIFWMIAMVNGPRLF